MTRLLVDILGLKHSFLSSEVVAQGGVLSSYQVFFEIIHSLSQECTGREGTDEESIRKGV